MTELRVTGDELADEAAAGKFASHLFGIDVAPLHGRSLSYVERRRLGETDLEITPVGVGTAPIGSGRDWPAWWGPQDEQESIRTIQTALELGVNWIDTAPFYGWGRAEEIVGRALQGRGDEVLVFTKCGTLPDEERGDRMDLGPETIRADAEASLRRLRRERLDLLQLHDVERALAVGPVAALQYQYSLLHREPERDVLPLASERGIGFLAWSPLAAGFLADGFDVEALDPDDFRRTHPFAQLDLTGLRAALRHVSGCTAAQAALAWVLQQKGVTAAIVGVRTEAEARELAGVAEIRLDLAEIEAAAP
jgi:aryl-alcohol dehydrogenase-like predicted oxidoreductase